MVLPDVCLACVNKKRSNLGTRLYSVILESAILYFPEDTKSRRSKSSKAVTRSRISDENPTKAPGKCIMQTWASCSKAG